MEERHVAVVTDSSRGIGRAIATSLAHQGVTVIINYRESKEAADALVAELSTITKAVAVQADVTVREDVSRLRDTVVETFGQVDILVNNAGAIITPGPWRDLSAADWRRGLDASLTSTFLCTQAFAPTLLNRSRARVVNVTSTYAFIGVTSVIAYTTAKAGVINMTRAFAKELAPTVTVNAVAPGNIDTEMTRNAGEALIRQVVAETPLQRLGRAEEVASAVSFLVSGQADFITGHVLVVDGGHVLR